MQQLPEGMRSVNDQIHIETPDGVYPVSFDVLSETLTLMGPPANNDGSPATVMANEQFNPNEQRRAHPSMLLNLANAVIQHALSSRNAVQVKRAELIKTTVAQAQHIGDQGTHLGLHAVHSAITGKDIPEESLKIEHGVTVETVKAARRFGMGIRQAVIRTIVQIKL